MSGQIQGRRRMPAANSPASASPHWPPVSRWIREKIRQPNAGCRQAKTANR